MANDTPSQRLVRSGPTSAMGIVEGGPASEDSTMQLGQKRPVLLQLVLLTLMLAGSLVLLRRDASPGYLATMILLVTSSSIGLILIHRSARQLKDPTINRLGYVFLLKYPVLFVVLNFGWLPELRPSATNPNYGDDAQVYFAGASNLVAHHFALSALPPLESTGIVFYYGAIVKFFGANPVAPLLFNAFFTLVVGLLLLHVAYTLRPNRRRHDWTLGLFIIIPEIIWFDAETDKDIVVVQLVAIAILSVALWVTRSRDERSTGLLLVGTVATGCLGSIRLGLVIPVLATIGLIVVLRGRSAGIFRLLLLLGFAGAAFLAPTLAGSLGSQETSYSIVLQGVYSNPDTALGAQFSSHSLARVLTANSLPKAIVTAPIRGVADFLAPLPAVNLSFSEAVQGQWPAWQNDAGLTSSLLYILIAPFILASAWEAIRSHLRSPGTMIQIPFLIMFIAVAGGTQLIDPRYRLVVVPFAMACWWDGRHADHDIIATSKLMWVLFIAASVAALAYFKAA